MPRAFRPLTTLDALDLAIQESQTHPVPVFKHSLTCGTSAEANEEMAALLDDSRMPTDIYLVRVQTERAISNAITDRFRIRHESPQVLILDRGSVVWHGSHWQVTASQVLAQLERAARKRSEVSSPA